jgi:hypothetical protein
MLIGSPSGSTHATGGEWVEESRLLIYVTKRHNDAILAGETLESGAILRHALTDALEDRSVIGEARLAELNNSIRDRVTARANHAVAIRKRIKRRWGTALAAFDELLALAEEINSILVIEPFVEFRAKIGKALRSGATAPPIWWAARY